MNKELKKKLSKLDAAIRPARIIIAEEDGSEIHLLIEEQQRCYPALKVRPYPRLRPHARDYLEHNERLELSISRDYLEDADRVAVYIRDELNERFRRVFGYDYDDSK